MLAGLGNIGSFAAVMLAPHVEFIRLVDRDTVELHNTINQSYLPEHNGRTKVEVTAERLERLNPQLQVERRVADLEDLPWEDFADVDVVLAGLDALRPRQVISEKTTPLQIPYIDGAVGDLFSRVQVLLPGQACLECNWGVSQYRQLTTEYPCQPGAYAQASRTNAPSCSGAATASLMVAQCMRLFGDDPPQESFEINGDLSAGKFVTSRRRRNQCCRFAHETAPRIIHLNKPFGEGVVGDLLAVAVQQHDQRPVQLEFRRGILTGDLFGTRQIASPEELSDQRDRTLQDFGLTPKDRIVVRASGEARAAHICFTSPCGSQS